MDGLQDLRIQLGHAVLDGIRQPLMALDSQRRIVLRNRRAGALLAQATLLCERSDSRLHACDAENDALLEQAFRELRGGERDHWAMRLAAHGGRRVAVRLRRLRHVQRAPYAALVVLEPPAPQEDSAVLAATFGLTPAEARVATLLSQGMSPKQVAAACGVAPCTVRTQVRDLFEKTGTHRQAELVRQLLMAAAF